MSALLSREEAAKLLNISVPSLDRAVKRGDLAVVLIGGRRLFRPESVQAFIDRHTKMSVS